MDQGKDEYIAELEKALQDLTEWLESTSLGEAPKLSLYRAKSLLKLKSQ